MLPPADHRGAPRADIALPCTLRRPIGRPIVARTVNVGAGGMLVSTARPLTVDESLTFDLANLDMPVNGHARVLRAEEGGRPLGGGGSAAGAGGGNAGAGE